MRILLSGGNGFLSRGMVVPLAAAGHQLRLLDVRPFETEHECMVGDVARLEDAQRAVEGMDGIIVAHMAPRSPDAYATPELCFDINVKGTTNLLFAAEQAGIRRAVVISSGASIQGYKDQDHSLPGNRPKGLYGLTKSCQELIAEFYATHHGFQCCALRIGYVLDGEKMLDKYGRSVGERNFQDCDRRDVGEVARLCLERDDLGYQVFHVLSTRESMDLWDVRHTCETLGWEPRYDFDKLPLDKGTQKQLDERRNRTA